jgi:F-box/leucine-rich repeat protein 2/20
LFGSPTPLSSSQLLRIARSVGAFARILDLQGFRALKPAEVVEITSALSLCLDLDLSHAPEPGATQLREVNLCGCRSLTSNALHYLLRRCPELEVLKLAGLDCVADTTLTEALSSAMRLRHLDVGRCANLPGRAIARFANACRARLLAGKSVPLKVLKMAGLKHVTKGTLSAVAQVFPALEVLDVSWCSGVSDAALMAYVEWEDGEPWTQWHESVVLTSREAGFDPGNTTKYTRRRCKLRHLVLSGSKNVSDSGIGALAYCMPELEFLELAGLGSALRDEGLIRLLRTTPVIRKLDLEDATDITDAVLDHLTPAPPEPVRKGQELDPQPGERLEHVVISSAQEVSPEAMCRLIKGCKNLCMFEADNTRVSSAVVREFVNRRRAREKRERSASSSSSGPGGEGGSTLARGSEIVAIDSRWVSDMTVRELANTTRPRRGFRSWDARGLAYQDAAAVNMPLEEGGGELIGQDECDATRVVVKTFQTWSNVDSVAQQREKRLAGQKKAHPHKEGKSGSPLWRRVDEDGEERGGCIIM